MYWRLIAFVLLVYTGASCRAGTEEAQTAEVAAAAPCPLSQCTALAEAQSILGFRPVEPAFLPDGWQLYSRRVESFELPLPARELEARARGVPISAIPEKSQPTLTLEYRFQSSNFVPAIFMREEPADAPVVSLSPQTPGCAEPVNVGGATALYGLGEGRVVRGQTPGQWLACAQDTPTDRQAHFLVVARGNVVIHVRAFPEAKLTKEDVLKIAASLRPAP
ncbi:MAG TPA: hypothetical protein VJB57_11980 [Dehalococcoidia bacterium]|nr:hypothetical protein [Dehalococcoidia bacterium]